MRSNVCCQVLFYVCCKQYHKFWVLPGFVFIFNFAPGLKSLAEQASRTFVLNGQRFLNRRLDSI